jgi:uncharacterized protein
MSACLIVKFLFMENDVDMFVKTVLEGYSFKNDSFVLGAGIVDGQVIPEAQVKVPLKTLNRHGLIAGATGTGKTKSVQLIAESLSEKGIPVLMMDIKGDLSGIAAEGVLNPVIEERHKQIKIPYTTKRFPVEFLSISTEKGAKMRATVTEFGPVLFSKILGLNDTQSSLVSLIFKFCDDERLPLIDLKDFKKVLQYISNEGKESIEKNYGMISPASVGTILRKVIDLEQQGAEMFFGELSFDVQDLLRKDENDYGYISIFRLVDIQDRPKLFSTFMLSLLAEVYASFPEAGDMDKPKLIIFLDEAHLIFNEASKVLLEQLETIIKLIRSKGVGIFFCTQNPADIPASILGQLGLKVQHALRAFTANDRKAIKLAAENYPETEFYEVENTLTSLGIGEALVTVLHEKGSPTPLVATMLRTPQSRMNILEDDEISEINRSSELVQKYNEDVDRKSAFELLSDKLLEKEPPEDEEKVKEAKEKRKEKSTLEEVLDSSITKQVGRTIFRELTRGLLGVLGVSGRRRRR